MSKEPQWALDLTTKGYGNVWAGSRQTALQQRIPKSGQFSFSLPSKFNHNELLGFVPLACPNLLKISQFYAVPKKTLRTEHLVLPAWQQNNNVELTHFHGFANGTARKV